MGQAGVVMQLVYDEKRDLYLFSLSHKEAGVVFSGCELAARSLRESPHLSFEELAEARGYAIEIAQSLYALRIWRLQNG